MPTIKSAAPVKTFATTPTNGEAYPSTGTLVIRKGMKGGGGANEPSAVPIERKPRR